MSSEIADPYIRDAVARAVAEAIARSWDRQVRDNDGNNLQIPDIRRPGRSDLDC